MRLTVSVILLIFLCQPVQAVSAPLCLWKVVHGNATVYLLGSIHAMREDMYPLPGAIEDAFQQSEVVVFEVDLTRLSPGEVRQVMAIRGMYSPPASLLDDLRPETLKLLRNYLEEVPLSFQQIQHMKPWNLALNIGVMELDRLGFRTDLGLDQYLQRKAVRQGKEIMELESFTEQIDLLSSDPIELQELSLRISLEERDQIQQELEQLVTAWGRGDADAMYEITVDSIRRHPELGPQMDRLVIERNVNMEEKIRSYLKTGGKYLVVAGALHMGGPQGIVSLLSSDYHVTQLTETTENQKNH